MRKYTEKKNNNLNFVISTGAVLFSLLANFVALWSLYITNKMLRAFSEYSSYYSGFATYMAYANAIWDAWEESYGKYMNRLDRDLVLREIYDISQRYRFDPVLVLSIVFVESRGNPRAISVAGARGLMQIMPSTFNLYARSNRIFDPVINVRVGTSYLKDLLLRYRNFNAVIIHYNGGSKALRYLPKETKMYISRVQKTYKVFSSGDFNLVSDFIENTAKGEW